MGSIGDFSLGAGIKRVIFRIRDKRSNDNHHRDSGNKKPGLLEIPWEGLPHDKEVIIES